MLYLFRPLDLRLGGSQTVVAGDACTGLLVETRGDLGAQGIVDIIQPGDEQAARNASGVPVALLLEAADLADSRSRRHRHHGLVRRMIHASERQLPFCRGGAAESSDITVREILRREPAQRVITVGLRLAENLIFAFGKIAAPLVLHDKDKASLHGLNGVAQRSALDVMLAVRRFPQDYRKRSLALFWRIDVGRQTDAIPHWHEDRQFCVRLVGQFGFQRFLAIFGIVLRHRSGRESDRQRGTAKGCRQ